LPRTRNSTVTSWATPVHPSCYKAVISRASLSDGCLADAKRSERTRDLGGRRARREGRGIFIVIFNESRENVGEADSREDEARRRSTIGGTEHRRSTQWEMRKVRRSSTAALGCCALFVPEQSTSSSRASCQ
jgi:hypothetical protein